MSRKILSGEKYMNDAFSSIYSICIQGLKRKEEESIWGPVEMPTKYNSSPTKIFNNQTVDVKATFDVNGTLPSAKEKVIRHDYVGNYSSIVSQKQNVINMENSELTKRKVLGANNNRDDNNQLKVICLRYQMTTAQPQNMNSSEAQNLNRVKINDHCYQKDSAGDPLVKKVIENKCKSHSDVNLNKEDKCIDKEHLVGNVNSDYSEQETVSTKFKSALSNFHDLYNPVNSEKSHFKEVENTEGNIPAIDTEVLSKNSSPYEKSSSHIKKSIVSCKQMTIKSSSELKKNQEMKHFELHEPAHQKKPENANKLFKEDCSCILNNSDSSSNKQNIMNMKHKYHDNRHSKLTEESSKKTVCIESKLEQEDLGKAEKYGTEVHNSDEFQKLHKREKTQTSTYNQNQSYKQNLPPRFKNNEENSINPKKHSVSKKIYSESMLLCEDSNKKVRQKKKGRSVPNLPESGYNSTKDLSKLATKKTHLCVRITDERCDKVFELMTDSFAISGIKKTFPKLSADIPDVDSGQKEMHCSANAMNIILRFVFYRSKTAVSSPIVCVEALAAAQSWNITNFFSSFQKEFLQDVLTPANAGLIFSYANCYNLKEICEACKNISADNIILRNNAPRKRQKTCLISISTYIEPLEINMPFELIDRETLEADLSLSFKRQIHNKFTFKAISGCISIIGFQVQLNEEHMIQKEKNENMLEFDYSIKNMNDDQTIDGGVTKPLRPINVIHFKKKLVLKPKEVGEIIIETEIEPYLCSVYKEKKVRIINSVSELDLTMESNRKIGNPSRELFLIGKFLYHETKT